MYEGKRYITTGLVDFRLRAKESRFLKAPDGARLKTAEYFKSHSIGFYRCQTNYNLSYISILNYNYYIKNSLRLAYPLSRALSTTFLMFTIQALRVPLNKRLKRKKRLHCYVTNYEGSRFLVCTFRTSVILRCIFNQFYTCIWDKIDGTFKLDAFFVNNKQCIVNQYLYCTKQCLLGPVQTPIFS